MQVLAIPQRKAVIQAFQEQGGHIAAVLPIHPPRALLRAFNFLPVEVWGPPRIHSSPGAVHLQAYVCSIVRNALSFILSGGLDVVDIIVVPHACDSLQGLGSLLLDFNQPKMPVIPFYQPRGRRSCDLEFLAPPLRIDSRTKELIARHYLEGRYANLRKKVAWVTSGAPVELLKALDFYVLYPENHGAICGTVRKASDLCTEAENAGYSRDLCSYARTDIGALLSGKTPVGKLPKPDLLVACTNICY